LGCFLIEIETPKAWASLRKLSGRATLPTLSLLLAKEPGSEKTEIAGLFDDPNPYFYSLSLMPEGSGFGLLRGKVGISWLSPLGVFYQNFRPL